MWRIRASLVESGVDLPVESGVYIQAWMTLRCGRSNIIRIEMQFTVELTTVSQGAQVSIARNTMRKVVQRLCA